MQNLNNVRDPYDQQILEELIKVSDYARRASEGFNLASLESVRIKVYTLLFELKLEGKRMPVSSVPGHAIKVIDYMHNAKLINNLIYTRWSTFLHNLSYFDSISKEDWNERNLFYTKCQPDKSNPQKVIFAAHHPGLPNSGGKCYSNAMLKIFSNNTWLYDYFLATEYNTSNFNSNKSAYGDPYVYENSKGETITKNPTKTNGDFTEAFIKLLRDMSQSGNKVINTIDFYNTLEKANPMFGGYAGDSKDFFLYLLQTVHSVINKPVPGVAKITKLPNQYDHQNTFNYFFTNEVQQEQSIVQNAFYGIYESSTQCLECRKKCASNQTQCPTSYGYQKNQFFTFALADVRTHVQKRCKSSGKPVPSDPIISLRDCFESFTKIEQLKGDNQYYCNTCHKLQDAEIKTQIYSLPNDVIINLDRGKDNKFPWRVDLPFYLDCHDTGVIQKTQQYEFKFLSGINQLIGESGNSAHFVAYTKSSKDGKWYRHSDQIVEQVSEQRIKDIKAPDTIKQEPPLTNCNVVYSGGDTHMNIAQKMLFYVLEKVNDGNYRRAIINRFDNLAKLPNTGYESAKRFAYLLMYACANRDNITDNKLSNLVCAVYEIIEGDSSFFDDSMEYYRDIIQETTRQISQNKNIASIQNINNWIVNEYCLNKITDSGYKTAIEQWLQSSDANKGKFLHLLMYAGDNRDSIQSNNLSNLICAVYEMVKNDRGLSDSYIECYKFLIQKAAEKISAEKSVTAVENIIDWIIDEHCLRKIIDQGYKTAIMQWLQNSGSNKGKVSHLLVYAATRNIPNQNILSNLICAVFDMIHNDDLLDDNEFSVNYDGNLVSVTRMQHYRNIIDVTVRQVWTVSNMNVWLYRSNNNELMPKSLTNLAVHSKYSNKGYSDQQLLSRMNMNNPYSVDDFVSYINSNFTRVNNQSMNIQISRGQIANVNIHNTQNNNTVRQNNQNNINQARNNQNIDINNNQNESINGKNQSVQCDVADVSRQDTNRNKNTSNSENKNIEETDNLTTSNKNNGKSSNLEQDKDKTSEKGENNHSRSASKNPGSERNENSERRSTILYIFLAILFIPTVIFSILFVYLAIQSYEFNCNLEKNVLQNLGNNTYRNKNTDKQKKELMSNSERKNTITVEKTREIKKKNKIISD